MRRRAGGGFSGRPIAGVGLKPQHVATILATRPEVGFFEVHAENYMGAGGLPHRHLTAIRASYPLSIHGVGLSLGGAQDLDEAHLERLRALVHRYEPAMVSEHLAWSSHDSCFLNDLLPVPYTRQVLDRVAGHVERIQGVLRRQILVENPSTYLAFEESDFEETEFIAELSRRSGCGLLLDVNNVYVASTNAGRRAGEYLAKYPVHRVQQVHLAGHSLHSSGRNGMRLLIDSHDRPVAAPVWELYQEVIDSAGPLPTLIERDANIPPWEELYAEARRAHGHLSACAAGERRAVAC
ncbi:MAG TPA: DUF692 domain-containing protein [Steroidobacteraceae bacterium]